MVNGSAEMESLRLVSPIRGEIVFSLLAPMYVWGAGGGGGRPENRVLAKCFFQRDN